MKSIALTLAVLFGALSFAQANTQSPTEDKKDDVVLEEVVAEETIPADATGTNTTSETSEAK